MFKNALNTQSTTKAQEQWFSSVFTICLHDFLNRSTARSGPGPPQVWGFTLTIRHTAIGRTRLYERSAWRRNLYLTTLNTHNRKTSVPRGNSNPQPQQTRDPAATRIGEPLSMHLKKEEVTKWGKSWWHVTFQPRDLSCSAVSEWIHA